MFDKRNVQNMYALTPMQEGMLFHALYQEGGTAYLEQTRYRLRGQVDCAVFEATWNTLMARHDVLRTLFVHKNVPQPLQILLKKRDIDFHFEDIQGMTPEVRSAHVQAYMEADRRRPFDLARDVLMRIGLFQVETELFEMIWTTHHILMDGWCLSILQEELYVIYHALLHRQQPPLEAPAPFSRYIKWLKQQDRQAAAEWWQTLLAGYRHSAGYPGWQSPARGSFEARNHKFSFTRAQTTAMRRLAAASRITLNTFVQALWGLMLGQACGINDVVFGATVSGRPPEIDGIEKMVGLFINTVPVRVPFDAHEPLAELLARLHRQALEGSAFHYCSLADIQARSPLKQQLLNHILVFENYPETEALSGDRQEFEALRQRHFSVEEISHFDHTHYNLSVLVDPGQQLSFNMTCNQAVFAPDTLELIQDHLERLAERILATEGAATTGGTAALIDQSGKPGTAKLDASSNHRFTEDSPIAGVTIEDLMVLTPAEQQLLAARGGANTNELEVLPLPGHAPAPPETTTQRELLQIWVALLEKGDLGIDDNFFEAGGHSLLATRIVARIHKHLGVEVSLPEFFDHPDVRALSALIDQKAPAQYQAIPALPLQEHYALSPAQRRLWILDQLEEDFVAYNLSAGYVLEGPLDLQAFATAVRQTVARHEILRTVFVMVNGEPRQQVLAAAPSGMLVVHNLTADAVSDAEVLDRAQSEARRPFDLTRGPLLRLTLLCLEAERQVLLLNVHHIICDGWSMPLLEADLLEAYNAAAQGSTWNSGPLSIQYRDYAAWQNARLAGSIGQGLRDYWQAQLAGDLPVLELPTDFPRRPARSYAGATIQRTLDGTLTRTLADFCRQQDASLFMGLTALLKILLLRYTGQCDIIVGTPLAGRQHPDLEDQIGFYVNTLPLRTFLTPQNTFSEVLAAVRQVAIAAYEHQSYPFDRLVEELALVRDVTRAPVFDVMLVLQNNPVQNRDIHNLRVTPLSYPAEASQFDLTFIVFETPRGLQVALNYNTDLFRADSMQRLLGHFSELTCHLLQHPGRPVAEAGLLTAAEVTWLREVNATTRTFPCNATLADLFEQQVMHSPHQVAVVHANQTLTYQELNRKANRLAHLLIQSHRVGADQPVGVLLERGQHQITALLGILKAGGTYLPIEQELPAERQDLMLTDSGCRVLLSAGNLLARAHRRAAMAVVDLDGIDSGPDENPQRVLAASNLAYIIYTSGSTGVPKGVMIEHGGFVNMITDQIRTFGIQPSDRVLQFASVAFDASLSEVFMALLAGATLVLADADTLHDPALFTACLEQQQVSVITLPPGYLHALQQHPLPTLRVLITAGEPAIVDDLAFYSRNKTCFNAYGPTETSVCASIHSVYAGYAYGNAVPIGRPVANTRIYILDAKRHPVPIGVTGEIVVAGVNLARGYLNQPEMTAAAFPTCPEDPQERLYLTGDLGCWRADGQIEYQGRRDTQLKIRGYRLEPAEIENCLRRHPGVQDALVLARRVPPHQQELVAWLVTPERLHTADLRQYLAATLPTYMLPAHFVCLPAFPLSVSGKIDRRALPPPEAAGPAADAASAANAPATDLEGQLLKIWQTLLGRPNIHRHTHFFEAGGDSIRAIQLASRLAREGLLLRVKHLFQYPTIAQLATVVTPQTTRAATDAPVRGEVPLTPIQHWFFEQFGEDPHHFNHAEMLFSPARLNVKALQSVLKALQEHHDALRMYYDIETDRTGGRKVRQYNADLDHPVGFEVLDLRRQTQPQQALREKAEALQASLNLATGPLMKVTLFQMADGDRLLFIIHHLVLDGVSWRILLENLLLGYQQLQGGQPVKLPPRTGSFKAWSEALQHYSRSSALQQQVEFWVVQEKTDLAPLPLDRTPTRAARMADTASASLALPENDTQRLLAIAPRFNGAGVQELLLTALARAATLWHGHSQTLIMLESHGRHLTLENLDISRTVGWFTSTFPFILNYAEGKTVDQQIQRIQKDLHNIPDKGNAYSILRYLTPPDLRPQLHFRLAPQINFNYLGQYEVDRSAFWQIAPEPSGTSVSPAARILHDLDIVALITNGALDLYINYNQLCYRPQTIQRLISDIEAWLKEIAAIGGLEG